jgi:hypothetical protein
MRGQLQKEQACRTTLTGVLAADFAADAATGDDGHNSRLQPPSVPPSILGLVGGSRVNYIGRPDVHLGTEGGPAAIGDKAVAIPNDV